ncbi:hypothetical protein PEC302110_33780 [Pectobacterium araliae]|uniref:Uncharacterized protein n=1 Tax=Pectobacterium araliae TaxID=3073862 RepID=A0AAN0MMN2_9GAMM|nr:hypothetical protein PEC302110_33780 [Pectobacterium sp. MAFF 302110]
MLSKREALLNLLVTALNEAIRQNKIDLNGVSHEDHNQKHEYILCEIDGKPTVINWADIGCDELRFSVWWDYNHEKHPQQKDERYLSAKPVAKKSKVKAFIGVHASCWIERKTGKYIMGVHGDRIFDIYVRQSNLDALMKLPKAKPLGYKDAGKFIF